MMLPDATLTWLEDRAGLEALRPVLLVLAEHPEGVEHLELLRQGMGLSEDALVRILMALPGVESRHEPSPVGDLESRRTLHILDPVLRQSIRARYSARR
jgi:hypothetical protein